MEKELYSLREVAVLLGYSIHTIRKWRLEKRFRVVVLNDKTIRVPKEEVERLKKGDE